MSRASNEAAETQSERDFVDFCDRQHWSAVKLAVSRDQGVRTPDFIVTTASGYEFVAEVTEFEPESPLELEVSRVRQHTLGNPLRAKLNAKKTQLRRFSDRYPTLIVVFAEFDNFTYLESTAFDSALYGEIAATAHVPKDPRQGVRFDNETHNAGRRFFGPMHNTRISAVGALDRRPQTLRIYHNRYAKNPLDAARTVLGTTRVEHFAKPIEAATGWEQMFCQN